MMDKAVLGWAALALIVLAGCERKPAAPETGQADPSLPGNDAENAAAEADKAEERDSAAARERLNAYAALVAADKAGAGADLWADPEAAAQFAADLDDYPKVAMEVGQPSALKGAAGSLYLSVPVTLKLTLRSGSPFDMACKAAMKRSNNVPGASEKQRTWLIQSIDC